MMNKKNELINTSKLINFFKYFEKMRFCTELDQVIDHFLNLLSNPFGARHVVYMTISGDNLIIEKNRGFEDNSMLGKKVSLAGKLEWSEITKDIALNIEDAREDALYLMISEQILSPDQYLAGLLKIGEKPLGIVNLFDRFTDSWLENSSEIFDQSGLEIFKCFCQMTSDIFTELYEKKNLSSSLLNSVKILISLLETSRSQYLVHSTKTAELVGRLAQNLNLKPDLIEQAQLAALIHDLGTIGADIKAVCKHDDLRQTYLQDELNHLEKGCKLLAGMHLSEDLILAVKHHHEHFSGRGYPAYLKGEEIPLISRLITLVESFVNLTTDKPFQKALEQEPAILQLQKYSGSIFDPDLLKNFLQLLAPEKS